MTLCLICGCLEPGKDGVGDYCLTLGNAFEDKTNKVFYIALADPYITKAEWDTTHKKLRLPKNLNWDNRIQLTSEFLQTNQIEVLSLHFVLFAYHPKGTPFLFAHHFKKITPRLPLHIMFHELWVGEAKTDSIKLKLLGTLQSKIIKSLVDSLKPFSVQSSNLCYQQMLKNIRISSTILPIFGSVPVKKMDLNVSLTIRRKNFLKNFNINDTMIAVVFGTIHQEWDPCEALQDLAQKSKCLILFAGRNGTHLFSLLQRISENCSRNIETQIIGELGTSDLSELFHLADFAFTSTPFALLEKSSSCCSLIEHGLPVLITRKDWNGKNINLVTLRAPKQTALYQPNFNWQSFFSKRTRPKDFKKQTIDILKKEIETNG